MTTDSQSSQGAAASWVLIYTDADGSHETVVAGEVVLGREKTADIVIPEPMSSRRHAAVRLDGDKLLVEDLGSTNGTQVNGRSVNAAVALKDGDRIKILGFELAVRGPADNDKTQVAGATAPAGGDATMVAGAGADVAQAAAANPDATQIAPAVPGAPPAATGNPDATQIASAAPATNAGGNGDATQIGAPVDLGNSAGAGLPEWRQSQVTDSGTRIVSVAKPQLVGVGGAYAGRKLTVSMSGAVLGRNPGNQITVQDPSVSGVHAKFYEQNGSWRVEDEGSSNGTYVSGKKVDMSPLEPGDVVTFGKVQFRFEIPEHETGAMGTVAPELSPSPTPAPKPQPAPAPAGAAEKAGNPMVYALLAFLVVGAGMAGYFMLSDQKAATTQETAPAAPATESAAPPAVSPAPAPAPAPVPPVSEAAPESAPVAAEPVASPGSTVPAPARPVIRLGDRWAADGAGLGTPASLVAADLDGEGGRDVVIAWSKGAVRVFDGRDGRAMGEFDAGDTVTAAPTLIDVNGDGQDDIVVAGHANGVAAYARDGGLLWRTDAPTGRVVNAAAILRLNDDGIDDLVLPSLSEGLVALDGATGKQLWNSKQLTRGAVVARPLVADLDGDGVSEIVSVSNQGQVLALGLQGGLLQPLWEFQAPRVLYASPVLAGSGAAGTRIILGTFDEGIVALDAATGQQVWTAMAGKAVYASPVALAGERVLAVDHEGDLAVFSAADGNRTAALSFGVPVESSPVHLGNNMVLVLDTSGGLHVFDALAGKQVVGGQIPGADAFVATPVVADFDGEGGPEAAFASQNGQVSSYSLGL